ncbi:hypothetical protein GCM10027422_16940 [Hymenobacter arcticus]
MEYLQKLGVAELELWGLVGADLHMLPQLAAVQVHLAYPGYQFVVHLAPRERGRQIAAYYRQAYQYLVALLPVMSFTRIGSRNRPTGLTAHLRLSQLPPLLQQSFVSGITIESIEDLVPREVDPEPSFWCIQARFAIQIENATNGMQTYEDRLLVVKAFTEEEAQQKLLPGFESYAEPYLNGAGLLVRWQFEAFTNSYCLDFQSADAFLSAQGAEVFSTLHNRRLRPDGEWHPAK